MMSDLLWVALGGGLGSLARFGITRVFSYAPAAYDILAINLLGSFIMGALILWSSAHRQRGRLFLGVGVLGGFTTFSTFVLNMQVLAAGSGLIGALGYGVGGLMGGLAACAAGAFCMNLWYKFSDSPLESQGAEDEDVL